MYGGRLVVAGYGRTVLGAFNVLISNVDSVQQPGLRCTPGDPSPTNTDTPVYSYLHIYTIIKRTKPIYDLVRIQTCLHSLHNIIPHVYIYIYMAGYPPGPHHTQCTELRDHYVQAYT